MQSPTRTIILHSHFFLPTPFHRSFPCLCRSTRGDTEGGNNGATSPETAEIRFRRGSRRRKKEELNADPIMASKAKAEPKKWEEMSMSEKAIELYVGEKGALFWLNKFAYASIYIVIGAWILFRFVGPALNLYQLDTPPLSPTAILKGS